MKKTRNQITFIILLLKKFLIVELILVFLVTGCSVNGTNTSDEILALKNEIASLKNELETLKSDNAKQTELIEDLFNYPDNSVSLNLNLNYHKSICKFDLVKNITHCFLVYNKISFMYKGIVPEKIVFLEHVSSGKFGVFYLDEKTKELSAVTLYTIGPKGLDKVEGNGLSHYLESKVLNAQYSLYEMSEGGYIISNTGLDYINENWDLDKLSIDVIGY